SIFLRKAVYHYCTLFHSRKTGNTGIRLPIPNQFAINLVCKNIQVSLFCQIRNLAQVFRAGYTAGWIGRRIDQDNFGLWRNRIP
ncbi:hypothetical protein LPJCHP_LPJCHP_18515, partial [Dysosmobacter welbionis]